MAARRTSLVLLPAVWIERQPSIRLALWLIIVPMVTIPISPRGSGAPCFAMLLHYLFLLLAIPALCSARRILLGSMLHAFGTAAILLGIELLSSILWFVQPLTLRILFGSLLGTVGVNVAVSAVTRWLIWCRHGSRVHGVEGICRQCGYRVDNIPSNRCPECGTPIVCESGPFAVHIIRRVPMVRILLTAFLFILAGTLLVFLSPLTRSLGYNPLLVREGILCLAHSDEHGALDLIPLWNYAMGAGAQVRQQEIEEILGAPVLREDIPGGGEVLCYLDGATSSDKRTVAFFEFSNGCLTRIGSTIARKREDGRYECEGGLVLGSTQPGS